MTAKLRDWVGEHAMPCPICRETAWEVGEHVVQISPASQLFYGGGLTYPMIMLISAPCGYVQLISAVALGVVPAAEHGGAEESGNG